MAAAAHASTLPNWTGSIPTWLLLIFGLVVAWRVSRGGGGQAVTELSEANKVLTKALEKNERITAEQAQQIAVLTGRTDVVLAVRPIMEELDRKAQDRFEAAQIQSREHHDATLAVLQAMTISLNGKEHS